MAVWTALAAMLAVALVSAPPAQARPSALTTSTQAFDVSTRQRRDISLRGQTVNQLDRRRLLELISRVDTSRCFAKWACDIMAREEAQRAAEERDLATLFMGEELDAAHEAPDSPQFVYLAAASRGRASGGNRSVCDVPTCSARPEDMLRMLRQIEELSDLVQTAGRRQRERWQRPPLVVFEVVEGRPGDDRPTTSWGATEEREVGEEDENQRDVQLVLFEVVEGKVGNETSQEKAKDEAEEREAVVETEASEKESEMPMSDLEDVINNGSPVTEGDAMEGKETKEGSAQDTAKVKNVMKANDKDTANSKTEQTNMNKNGKDARDSTEAVQEGMDKDDKTFSSDSGPKESDQKEENSKVKTNPEEP